VLGGCRIVVLQDSGRSRSGWGIQSYGWKGSRSAVLASKAVIFGVNPTGPHILVVNSRSAASLIQLRDKALYFNKRKSWY
jgi:hypothetical protein